MQNILPVNVSLGLSTSLQRNCRTPNSKYDTILGVEVLFNETNEYLPLELFRITLTVWNLEPLVRLISLERVFFHYLAKTKLEIREIERNKMYIIYF